MQHKTETEESRISKPTLPPAKKSGQGWLRRTLSSVVMVAVAIGVIIALLVLLPKRNGNTPPAALKPVAVRVMEVQSIAEVDDSFRILGSVEPDCITAVAAEVSGRVEAFAGRDDKVIDRLEIKKGPAQAGTVEEGDSIKAGQPIVYINTDLLQAAFDQSKADCDFVERETKRLEDLFAKNVATKSEVDNILRQRDMAKASLEINRANLERSVIVAPKSGILNSLPVEVGEYVSPGTVVAQIVDMDTVKVILEIPERDISFLKVGQDQDIFFTLDELKENGDKNSAKKNEKKIKKITGKITYISELADPNALTTRLEISVDNHDRQLRSGQMVYAQLKRRTLHDVIMVPLKTIVPLEKGYVAYVNNKGQAERRDIKLDPSMFRDDQIRVEEGLAPGDRLIIEPNIGPGQAIFEVGNGELPLSESPSGGVAEQK